MFDNEKILEEYVDIISRYDLTPSQYLSLAIIHHQRVDLLKVCNHIGLEQTSIDSKTGSPYYIRTFRDSEFRNLEARGYIMDTNRPGHAHPEFFIIHDKIKSELFDLVMGQGDEFWDSYPNTMKIQGKVVGAKTCDKEWFRWKYASVARTREEHKEMLKILDKFKRLVKAGKINPVGIEKYMKSDMWETIKDIDEGDTGDYTDYTTTI